MEPEGSLPHLQELSTCPYSEPDQSSPHHPILFLQDPSKYYPPTYVLVSLVVSVPLTFLPTSYTSSSSPIRATWPAHFILLNLINQQRDTILQMTGLWLINWKEFGRIQ
jgi:hypothetical protein